MVNVRFNFNLTSLRDVPTITVQREGTNGRSGPIALTTSQLEALADCLDEWQLHDFAKDLLALVADRDQRMLRAQEETVEKLARITNAKKDARSSL